MEKEGAATEVAFVKQPSCARCGAPWVVHAQAHAGKPAQLSHYCEDGCRKVRNAVSEQDLLYILALEQKRNSMTQEQMAKWVENTSKLRMHLEANISAYQNAVRSLDTYVSDPSKINRESLEDALAQANESLSDFIGATDPPRVTSED